MEEAVKMHSIQINNCNNIVKGSIDIEPNRLNIKYGINGTGKTTIARAIYYAEDAEKIKSLQSYYSLGVANASVNIQPKFEKVLVFDENFINQVVFKENEVIRNTFEVFLKTSDYDEKKLRLDKRLKLLKEIVIGDQEIVELKKKLISINGRFTRSKTGKLNTAGTLKSLLSKENLYNIPVELEAYRPFIENSNNIEWIDWVNKGHSFDNISCCPYCTDNLKIEHNQRKEIFKQTYTKKDSQNLKEALNLVEDLEEYMVKTKFEELIEYIKNDTADDLIKAIIQKLTSELEFLINRFGAIEDFGRKSIATSNIADIEEQIMNMEFPISFFELFGGDKLTDIFENINSRVTQLKAEVSIVKKEMGELKGILLATVGASQKDINDFLKTAGINYEIEIQSEDETNSKTILKQCFNNEKTEVVKISERLSWGEKNAFALILFMYYANMQNADLIILDDPVSSFDSNKKYAILHRMFKNMGKQKISLLNKTVLLLTHDFEPITDFIVVGKISEDNITASFVWNDKGNICEKIISPEDVYLILQVCSKYARCEKINIVSRVAFLRKLCELNSCQGAWGEAYEILSCLVHAKPICRKISEDKYGDMNESDILAGLKLIQEFITDFDFDKLIQETYTLKSIKDMYIRETNEYLKIQIFREACELSSGTMSFTPFDEGWYKFIDETYHIQNDYLHYLDVLEFNVVPGYIVEKVDELMKNLKVD